MCVFGIIKMSNINTLGFGKNVNNEATPISVSGVNQNELKTISIETYNKYTNILKELKKLSLYLSILTDNYIRNNDIGD